MPQEKEIVCGKEQDTYRVTITGKNLNFSEYVNKNVVFKDMKGKELVTAILAAGGVLKIERRKNGKLTDGPNGEPAVQKFNSMNGRLWREEHRKNDLLNDGMKGEPAVQEFNSRNGNRTRVEYRERNKRNDSKTGELAIQEYKNGTMNRGASYKDDKLVKELNAREISDYLKSRKEQATKKVKNVAPSLKL